jgi:dolichol kinase
MHGNIDWHEIRRKTFHILGGLILAALIYYEILTAWMVLLVVGVGIILSTIYTVYDVPIINYFLHRYERQHLRKKFPGKGVIYLFLALLVLMLSFEKDIVLAGIMIWAFGDSMSAIIGKHYPEGTRHPLNDLRILEGTIAGIIAGSIAAAFFVYWPFALIGATVSMAIESLDWKLYRETFDDNFFVPIVGSAVIYLLMLVF